MFSNYYFFRLILLKKQKQKQQGNFQFLSKIKGYLLQNKSQYDNYVKSLFFCLGGLVVLLHDHQTLFQGPFCPKQKQRGNFKF